MLQRVEGVEDQVDTLWPGARPPRGRRLPSPRHLMGSGQADRARIAVVSLAQGTRREGVVTTPRYALGDRPALPLDVLYGSDRPRAARRPRERRGLSAWPSGPRHRGRHASFDAACRRAWIRAVRAAEISCLDEGAASTSCATSSPRTRAPGSAASWRTSGRPGPPEPRAARTARRAGGSGASPSRRCNARRARAPLDRPPALRRPPFDSATPTSSRRASRTSSTTYLAPVAGPT